MGSFANVCIYRLPRNESIIWPSSKCPSCGTPIKPWDNVPLLSYLFLRGKCRACGKPISIKYPLVEGANGLLYLAVFYRFGLSSGSAFYFLFVSALLVITFIDFEFQEIPDEITIPGTVLGLIAGWLILPDPFIRFISLGYKNSIIGTLLGFGLFYLVAFASRGGMGGGDIKMMSMVGAVLGWKGVLFTTFAGSLTGSVIGIYLMLFKGRGRKSKIPFGPFLALGAVLSLLLGQEIITLYMRYVRP